MTSSQVSEPPSASKAALIQRFLDASGIQRQIDNGDHLAKYAHASPLLISADAPIAKVLQTLRVVYEPYRQAWQEEYECHVNGEFSEAELAEVVDFLERPAGQLFLQSRWRMDAYISTNTEHLLEEIIVAAMAKLKS